MKKRSSPSVGSSFDSFLREEGSYEETSTKAIKRVLARQFKAVMEERGLTKTEMARRMGTSRSALDRLLDPDNEAVTLSTLRRVAESVGRGLHIEFVATPDSVAFDLRRSIGAEALAKVLGNDWLKEVAKTNEKRFWVLALPRWLAEAEAKRMPQAIAVLDDCKSRRGLSLTGN